MPLLSQLFFLLFIAATVIFIIIFLIHNVVYVNEHYKTSAYYQITKNSYASIKYDKGKYAEYLTYELLRHFEKSGGKFLFNILIPKENGETTEIDILLICSKCLFVFECKNYSGWIFGHEEQKNWTQTLPQGLGNCHKEYFYNPIMQNSSHIKHLKNFIGEDLSIQSIIVFSDRGTLKNITTTSKDVSVINHYHIADVIAEICNKVPNIIYSEEKINDIYNKLYPCTQGSLVTKKRHTANIRNKFKYGQVNKKTL